MNETFIKAEEALVKLKKLSITFTNSVPVGLACEKLSDFPTKEEMNALNELLLFLKNVVSRKAK